MDTTLILNFLKELKENNNKEWMDSHRNEYKKAKEAFTEITEYFLNHIKSFDEDLEDVVPKDCIFKINRDIRFSNDKSPYKHNFGAAMAEGGRHSLHPIYYLHLQPYDESFIAGGLYMPPGDSLNKVRQEIDYNQGDLKKITQKEDFQKYFGAIQGEKLKKGPKGYPTDHPNIELLKLKSFLVIHNLDDQTVTSKEFFTLGCNLFKAMHPFNQYLNVALS